MITWNVSRYSWRSCQSNWFSVDFLNIQFKYMKTDFFNETISFSSRSLHKIVQNFWNKRIQKSLWHTFFQEFVGIFVDKFEYLKKKQSNFEFNVSDLSSRCWQKAFFQLSFTLLWHLNFGNGQNCQVKRQLEWNDFRFHLTNDNWLWMSI